VRTADKFWMQSSVMAAMVEDSRVRISPVGVQGIWPEQYIVEEVAIAWDWYVRRRSWEVGRSIRRVLLLFGCQYMSRISN